MTTAISQNISARKMENNTFLGWALAGLFVYIAYCRITERQRQSLASNNSQERNFHDTEAETRLAEWNRRKESAQNQLAEIKSSFMRTKSYLALKRTLPHLANTVQEQIHATFRTLDILEQSVRIERVIYRSEAAATELTGLADACRDNIIRLADIIGQKDKMFVWNTEIVAAVNNLEMRTMGLQLALDSWLNPSQ